MRDGVIDLMPRRGWSLPSTSAVDRALVSNVSTQRQAKG